MHLRISRRKLIFALAVIFGATLIIAEVYLFIPSVRVVFVGIAEQLGADEFLVGRLADRDLKVRSEAGESLVRRGAKAVPALLAKLNDPEAGERRLAASTLAKVGTTAVEAVPELKRTAIEDQDESVLEMSGKALGIVARGHTEIVQQLLDMMNSSNDSVRLAGTRAAGGLGDARAVPLLISSLKHANAKIREEAAESLGELKTMAIAAIPALLDTANDPVIAVRSESSEALAKIINRADPGAIEPDVLARVKTAIEKGPADGPKLKPNDDDP